MLITLNMFLVHACYQVTEDINSINTYMITINDVTILLLALDKVIPSLEENYDGFFSQHKILPNNIIFNDQLNTSSLQMSHRSDSTSQVDIASCYLFESHYSHCVYFFLSHLAWRVQEKHEHKELTEGIKKNDCWYPRILI